MITTEKQVPSAMMGFVDVKEDGKNIALCCGRDCEKNAERIKKALNICDLPEVELDGIMRKAD